MLRRTGVTLLLGVLVALATVVPAEARPRGPFYWDVSLSGSQDASWSFAIEDPVACPDFEGRTGQGKGRVSMRFATTAKRPFRLRFDPGGSSNTLFDADVPLTYTNQGGISSVDGEPCGTGGDQPTPVPHLNTAGGCGTQATELKAYAWLSRKKLRLDGQPTKLKFPAECPGPDDNLQWGVYPQGVWSGVTSCKPDEYALNTLVVPATTVSPAKLTAKKAFKYDVNDAYKCEFPPRFVGDRGKREITTVIRYTLSFKPRAHKPSK